MTRKNKFFIICFINFLADVAFWGPLNFVEKNAIRFALSMLIIIDICSTTNWLYSEQS